MRKLAPAALAIAVLALTACAQSPAPVASRPAVQNGADSTIKLDDATSAAPGSADVTIAAMWAFDVTDVNEIRKHATAVVDAEVVSVAERGRFIALGSPMPYVDIRIRIREVLQGPKFESSIVTVLYAGGEVTLQQVLDATPKESAEKSGLSALSKEELARTTQTYAYEEQAELVPGARYVLALSENEDGTYTIGPAGFAVFRADGEVFVNDITGTRYTVADFRG